MRFLTPYGRGWAPASVLIVLVGLLLAPRDARSQERGVTVAGRVASSVDRRDVVGVMVAIPDLRFRSLTDSLGVFRLVDVPAGTHDVTFRRIGYYRASRKIRVGSEAPDGLFDLGTFLIAPVAAQIEDVIVSATTDRYRRLELAGFYDRWQTGAGAFADIDDIAGMGLLVDFTDILRYLPGFRVEVNRNFGNPLPPLRTEFGLVVEEERGTDYRKYLISSRRSSRDDCPPQVVLDAVRMGSTDDFNVDNLNLQGLVGVEAYASASEIPTGFNWSGSNCGVILLWTQ